MDEGFIVRAAGVRDLIRVTAGSQARFSACGYTKSKQCMEPPAEPASPMSAMNLHGSSALLVEDVLSVRCRMLD